VTSTLNYTSDSRIKKIQLFDTGGKLIRPSIQDMIDGRDVMMAFTLDMIQENEVKKPKSISAK